MSRLGGAAPPRSWAEAKRRLDEPDLLKGATDRLLRRMREGLDDLGLEVRIEMLPPPPA